MSQPHGRVEEHGDRPDPYASRIRTEEIRLRMLAVMSEQPSTRCIREAEQRLHRLVSAVADEVLNSRKEAA